MSDSTINVRFGATDAGLEEAIKKAEAALLSLSKSVKGTSDGLNPLNSATREVIQQWDRGAATLDRAANAFQHVTDAIEANEISAQQAARVLEQIEGAANDASKGMGGFGGATAGATREFVVLAHEAVAGNFSRIPGSLMVLTERMGGLSGATLGWAAAIGVAGFAAFELVARWNEVQQAVKAAAGEMIIVGQYQGGSSDSAVRAGINRLQTTFGASAGDAGKAEDSLRTLGGAAAQFTDQIRDAAAAEATLDHADLVKTTSSMVSAFNSGAAGALRWAESNHVLTADQTALIDVMVKGGNETGAFSAILAAMQKRFVDSGTAVADANKQLKDYMATAQLFDGVAGGLALQQSGLNQPSADALKPKAGSQDYSASLNQEITAVTSVNKALQERATIGEKLNQVRQAERDGIAGATAAEATLYDQLATVHTDAEKRGHEATLASLQADLVAARDNATQRIAILQQIAAEQTKYNGPNSDVARTSATAIVQAEQQAADKRLQIELQVLDGKLVAARFSITEQIAIENQKIALLAQAGKQETTEYQAELNRRDELVQKSSDEQFQIAVEKLRQEQAAHQDDYAFQIKIEDQILDMYRQSYRDQTVQFQQEVLRRQDLLNKDADFQAGIVKKVADANAEIAARSGNVAARAGGRPGGRGNNSLLSLFGGDDSANDNVDAAIAAQQASLDKQMAEFQAAFAKAAPSGNFQDALAARNSATQDTDPAALASQITGGGAGNPTQIIDILDKAATAQATYADKVTEIQQQAAQATKQAWDQVFEGMENKVNSSLIGILNGTTSLQAGFRQVGASIESTFLNAALKIPENMAKGWLESVLITKQGQNAMTAATQTGVAQRDAAQAGESDGVISQISQMIAGWLGMETAKTGATEAGNAIRTASNVSADTASAASTDETASSGIMKHAASAAAAVYDDVSQIPVVGWILAPVAAGAAFAAVSAYDSVFSAAGGWDKVPFDGAPAVLHANEMVLSAKYAKPLRSMLEAANGNGPSAAAANVTPYVRPPVYGSSSGSGADVGSAGGGGLQINGDIHVHATNAQDAGDQVLSALNNAARNGIPNKYPHLQRAMKGR